MSRTKRPHVGYVLKRFPRFSETFIVTELLAHQDQGLDVTVFALRTPNEPYVQDSVERLRFPVHYLVPDRVDAGGSTSTNALQASIDEHDLTGALMGRERWQAQRLASEVRRLGIDLLHAHFASSATTVARAASNIADVPYTLTAHAKDIFHEAVDQRELHDKLTGAAAVVTVSDFNVAHFRARFGAHATARVTRIYNGIDLERFRFAPRSDPSLRVVAVGRLVEKKGFGDLIDAVALLRARGVDVVCDIVGTGPLEDDLRQRIAARGMDAWIQLLGPRPQKDVIELVRGARAMVAPCIVGDDGNRDGLPTVLLEAMALGTPCVATDVTGIPEIVREGETGLLVPERSPEALAEALQRLLRDASLGPRLARSARLMIEREFDIRRNTAAMRELFVEVANPTVELAR